MAALTAERLLTVWERAVDRHPIDRALLLFALAEPDTPSDRLADVCLSHRNSRLWALQRACFGDRLAVWVDCPACGERLEIELDAAGIPAAPADVPDRVEIAGYSFRRPTSRHLAEIADAPDQEAAARRLLIACAESPDALPRDEEALANLLDLVDAAMDDADPGADLSLSIDCPACGHADAAVLDIGEVLWDEFEKLAGGVLDDVGTLARAFGWSERDILAMSETRRAAYLAQVQP